MLDKHFYTICSVLVVILLVIDLALLSLMLYVTPPSKTVVQPIHNDDLITKIAVGHERTVFQYQKQEIATGFLFNEKVATETSACNTEPCKSKTNLSNVSQSDQEEGIPNKPDSTTFLATESESEPHKTSQEPRNFEPEADVYDYGSNELTVTCYVTAYCGCSECSGEYGPYDVFGNRCVPNHTIGVDPSVIPYGTQVIIDGTVYTASDTGSAINGYEIDIYHETHEECEDFATGYYEVTIL